MGTMKTEVAFNIYGEPCGTRYTCSCGMEFFSHDNKATEWNNHLMVCRVPNKHRDPTRSVVKVTV